MIKLIVLAGLGSFIGGILRVLISVILNLKFEKNVPFPIGIFAVNVIGCFLIGLFFAYFKEKPQLGSLYMFLTMGILGGFTTFSTFSLEVVQLFEQKEVTKAFLYAFSCSFLGILACYAGTTLV